MRRAAPIRCVTVRSPAMAGYPSEKKLGDKLRRRGRIHSSRTRAPSGVHQRPTSANQYRQSKLADRSAISWALARARGEKVFKIVCLEVNSIYIPVLRHIENVILRAAAMTFNSPMIARPSRAAAAAAGRPRRPTPSLAITRTVGRWMEQIHD
jgi:hypothetical protein